MIIRISLAIFYVFFAIILSQFVRGAKLKIVYWMIMVLLFVTCLNIYLTARYYINIRNNPGIKGEKGEPGKPGPQGGMGVCVIDTKCMEVFDCRKLIEDKIEEKSVEFRTVMNKKRKNMLLDGKDKKVLANVSRYVDLLDIKCKNMTKQELLNELEESLRSVDLTN